MSRLTKPLLKAAIQNAILGDGTGVCQMILTRPADEGFRLATADKVAPGGGMIASRTPGQSGTTYSGQNIFGDTSSRVLASAPSYDPKFVSVNPYLNPYLDYMLDKLAEGVAEAHQEWQVRQRIRGITVEVMRHRHPIEEPLTHLPFQTEVVIEDQSDHEMRGDLIDTTQRDFTPRTNARALAYLMVAEKAQNVNTPAEQLGGMDPDTIPRYEADAATTRKNAAASVSTMLIGETTDTKQGLVASDRGKYGDGSKYRAQAPGGMAFKGLFMFETWRKLVAVLKEQALRVIPAGSKLSDAGMSMANLAANNLSQGVKKK